MRFTQIAVIMAVLIAGIAGGYIVPRMVTAPSKTTPTPSPKTSPVATKKVTSVAKKGFIEGFLIYPSSFIPKDMRVCAEEQTTLVKTCVDQEQDSKYEANNGTGVGYHLDLDAGTYHVYAYLANGKNPATGGGYDASYRAYYNTFVTCGLLATCPTHDPINVVVNSSTARTDVYPHDWYNDTTPSVSAATLTPTTALAATATLVPSAPTPTSVAATNTPAPAATNTPVPPTPTLGMFYFPWLIATHTPTPTPQPIVIPTFVIPSIKINFP